MCKKSKNILIVLLTVFVLVLPLFSLNGCSDNSEADGVSTGSMNATSSKNSAVVGANTDIANATGGEYAGTVGVNIGITNNTNNEYNIWIGNTEDMSELTKFYPGNLRFNSIIMKAYGKDKDNLTTLKDTVILNVAKDGVKVTTQKIDLNKPFTLGMIIYINWDGSKFTIKE